ncbi:hypothetical protein EDB89DRAFT_2078471 [Lactarius sanguifluus]|nr:hypothetical protein EDB89DRAFT_2078471 [Lactarius sanguifluus]
MTLQLPLVSTSPLALARSCPPDAMLTTLGDPTVDPAFTRARKTDTDAASFKNASLTSESRTPAHARSRSRGTSVDISLQHCQLSNISTLNFAYVCPVNSNAANIRLRTNPGTSTSSSRHVVPSLGNVELAL